MTIDSGLSENACVITRCYFIKMMHKNLPNELKGPHSNAPDQKELFKINPNSEIVSKPKSDEHHKTVSQSL